MFRFNFFRFPPNGGLNLFSNSSPNPNDNSGRLLLLLFLKSGLLFPSKAPNLSNGFTPIVLKC